MLNNEKFLLSNLKKIDARCEQTPTMPQKRSIFKLNVPMETIPFENHFILEKGKWMKGFTREVQAFIFRVAEEKIYTSNENSSENS